MESLKESTPAGLYWWNRRPNFGDAIAPLLLERFAYIKAEWSPVERASIVSVGSILEHIPNHWEGYVIGSGILRENAPLSDSSLWKVLSLRGPLSAKYVPGNYGLADPGILADELVGDQEKQYDYGILPHWKDRELVSRTLSLAEVGASYLCIDTKDDPRTVLKQVGSCHKIITSSLHGLIVADSFGLPRQFDYSTGMDTEGGDFKFRDYSASIHTPLEVGKMVQIARPVIEELKFVAYDVYRELASLWQ